MVRLFAICQLFVFYFCKVNLFFSWFQGDGTFAIRDIPPLTMVMQYGGYRFLNNTRLDKEQKSGGAYTQHVGICKGVVVDIPKGFEDSSKYNGTLAHKTNMNFDSNVFAASVC